ncbi:MAG: hypothetical protein ACODAF_05795 [Actinomycetota bacterium]
MADQTSVFGFPIEETSDVPGGTLREPDSLAQAIEDELQGSTLAESVLQRFVDDFDGSSLAEDVAEVVLTAMVDEGNVPGQRIATEVLTSDSSTFTNTEVELMSVTAALVEGRTYAVVGRARFGSTNGGDDIVARLREDDVNGDLLQHAQIEQPSSTSSLGFGPLVVYAEYTAGSTGDKTFALTGDRNFGSGDCRLDATSAAPAYLYVDYIRSTV